MGRKELCIFCQLDKTNPKMFCWRCILGAWSWALVLCAGYWDLPTSWGPRCNINALKKIAYNSKHTEFVAFTWEMNVIDRTGNQPLLVFSNLVEIQRCILSPLTSNPVSRLEWFVSWVRCDLVRKCYRYKGKSESTERKVDLDWSWLGWSKCLLFFMSLKCKYFN